MPKLVSLTLREALFAPSSDEIPVLLLTIEHDDLVAPLRLSSDPTQRITDDPLVYGTISNDETYYFALMSTVLPHDEEGRTPEMTLIFDNVTSGIVKQARSIRTPLEATLALVLASDPDTIEEEYSGYRSTGFKFNSGQMTLELVREPLEDEPFPCDRMTKARFPGLFK